MVVEVGVHRPDVVRRALHVPDGHHRRQHRVVLVVVLVHAVAADGVQVRDRIDVLADDVEMRRDTRAS